jgi:hypothetical protein
MSKTRPYNPKLAAQLMHERVASLSDAYTKKLGKFVDVPAGSREMCRVTYELAISEGMQLEREFALKRVAQMVAV